MTYQPFLASRRAEHRHNSGGDVSDTSPHTDLAGFDVLLKERRKMLAGKTASVRRRRLVTGYLPALRDFAALTEPERIEAAITVLCDRMATGLDKFPGNENERANDLFDELLAEYEALEDVRNLAHPGTPAHPVNYLMERIGA